MASMVNQHTAVLCGLFLAYATAGAGQRSVVSFDAVVRLSQLFITFSATAPPYMLILLS